MKKTLILYFSNTGDTQKYAEDIASAVEADVLPLKKFKWKRIDDYDIVVFAGWIMGGNIKGLNDFLSHWDDCLSTKDVIVIGCGMSPATAASRASLINQNLLDMYHLRFYQFRGSFDFNRLSGTYRALMKMGIRRFESDPNASPEQRNLSALIEQPIEYYDDDKVNRVIQVIHSIEEEQATA